ncbi:MAG: metal-dependent hydrolase [Methanoregulaceae archaeon]|jgi:inner membrane protein|nr:metal-dependent hydrolase [Methanoregulaceae archaeon]
MSESWIDQTMINIPGYNLSFVDSITHALLVASLLDILGVTVLIPFGILGAVILDLDILLYLFSSKRPHWYMFIHGGAAHSLTGAAGIAIITYAILYFLIRTTEYFSHITFPVTFTLLALIAVIAGTMTHVGLDFLASPGIPLFWPWKETRYTPGIFAGPSPIMIFISLGFIILYIAGLIPVSYLKLYGSLFLAYLAICVIIRIATTVKIKGTTYPTINPLKWLVIEKENNCWALKFVDLLTGLDTGNRTWPALQGVTEEDIGRISDIPEVRRVRYHSAFTIAHRRDNGDIVIEDPSRVEGIVRYPPYYMSIVLRQTDHGKWEAVTEQPIIETPSGS